MQDDDAPTPEELAEAEALARALEARKDAPGMPPAAADALGAAALLQHERRLAAFDAQAEARLERRIAEALPSTPVRRWARRTAWLVPAGALAAAGMAVVFFATGQRARAPEAAAVASVLPAPPAALLEAQAQALAQESTAPLEAPMRAHRAAMLAAMQARTGGER